MDEKVISFCLLRSIVSVEEIGEYDRVTVPMLPATK